MKKFFFIYCLFLFSTISTFSQSPLGKVLYLNANGTQVWGFLPPESFQNGAWTLTGNSISGSNIFLGTTNLSDLIFRTNNTERMRIFGSGNLSITGDVLPSIDNTFDLGSSSLRWRDLYLSGTTIHFGSEENGATIGYDAESRNISFNRGVSMNGKLILSFGEYEVEDNEVIIDGTYSVVYIQSNGDGEYDLVTLPEDATNGQIIHIFYNPCNNGDCDAVVFYPVAETGGEGDEEGYFGGNGNLTAGYTIAFTFIYFNGIWHFTSASWW